MKYHVSPLTCGRCIRSITEALQAVDSGARVQVDLAAGTVEADGAFDATTVVATLAAIGYQASPAAATAGAGSGPCCGTCHA
jgi:copper chaperone